jgi:hypothetical protein
MSVLLELAFKVTQTQLMIPEIFQLYFKKSIKKPVKN